MLIPVEEVQEFIPSVKGVLHIGAHLAEEVMIYARLGAEVVYWVEANPFVYEELCEFISDMPSHHAINYAVSNVDHQNVILHIANNGQSSSLLELGTHKKMHPEVFYTGDVEVETITINTLATMRDFSDVDFLNLDIQGTELDALKGATNILPQIKGIYCEVNQDELYKDCALLPEIEEFLSGYGFSNVLTDMTHFGWGDALFVRK